MLTSFQLAHVMWPTWGWGRHTPTSTAATTTTTKTTVAPIIPSIYRYLAQALATGFHRFLARFSGRRRWRSSYHHKNPPPWAFLVLVLASSLISIVDACSSRTTPKPRPPPPPTQRPNITFPTYECPPAYAAWYCLNGAKCFTVKIGEALLYNCECSEGYMGPRCEYKDLDGSYLPSQQKLMLETASIAGGVAIAVLLVVILCIVAYLHYKRHTKATRTASDCVDGMRTNGGGGGASTLPAYTPTFGTRWRTQQQQTTTTHVDFPVRVVHDRTTTGAGDIKHHLHPQHQSNKTELQQVTTLLTSQQP